MKSSVRNGNLWFHCPGCNASHRVAFATDSGPQWEWNHSEELPTLSPSILVQGIDLTDKGKAEIEQWEAQNYPPRSKPFDSVLTTCHSWVKHGTIQFLSDCTHALAGQTVDLPDWESIE